MARASATLDNLMSGEVIEEANEALTLAGKRCARTGRPQKVKIIIEIKKAGDTADLLTLGHQVFTEDSKPAKRLHHAFINPVTEKLEVDLEIDQEDLTGRQKVLPINGRGNSDD